MRSYRYLHYYVFTGHLFGGNQLAVVLDGRGLPAETMQAIAKEMNFSETTFMLPAEQPDTDVRMRIFTPGEELPVAGHPTIGATFALARTGVIERGRERFVFGLNIGPVPVTMTWNGDALSFAAIRFRIRLGPRRRCRCRLRPSRAPVSRSRSSPAASRFSSCR